MENEAAKIVLRPTQPRKIRRDVHLVNPYDGVVDRRFRCHRCARDLPEGQFKLLGDKAMPGGRHVLCLHPLCWTCREQTRGIWTKHPGYSVAIDRFWQRALNGLVGGATQRRIMVVLTKDDVLGMYLEQGGKCALSGMQMDCTIGRNALGKRNFRRASVDRIDSDGNYTLDNIQIVCAGFNLMKAESSQQTFVELCRRVAAHADAKAAREAEALKSVA